jgi:hypothetical protein
VLGGANTQKQTIMANGEVAGHIVSWQDDSARRLVGYWIGAAYWGQGIATRALAAFVAGHERTRPLYALVTPENVGSRRVLEKCGFQRVGDIVTGSDGVDEILMRLTEACASGLTSRASRGSRRRLRSRRPRAAAPPKRTCHLPGLVTADGPFPALDPRTALRSAPPSTALREVVHDAEVCASAPMRSACWLR